MIRLPTSRECTTPQAKVNYGLGVIIMCRGRLISGNKGPSGVLDFPMKVELL